MPNLLRVVILGLLVCCSAGLLVRLQSTANHRWAKGHRTVAKTYSMGAALNIQDAGHEALYKALFDRFDHLQNGRINAFELKKTFGLVGNKITLSEAEELIEVYDLDNNGSLDYPEFRVLAESMNLVD